MVNAGTLELDGLTSVLTVSIAQTEGTEEAGGLGRFLEGGEGRETGVRRSLMVVGLGSTLTGRRRWMKYLVWLGHSDTSDLDVRCWAARGGIELTGRW